MSPVSIADKVRAYCDWSETIKNRWSCVYDGSSYVFKTNGGKLSELKKGIVNHKKFPWSLASSNSDDQEIWDFLQAPILTNDCHILPDVAQDNLTVEVSAASRKVDHQLRTDAAYTLSNLMGIHESINVLNELKDLADDASAPGTALIGVLNIQQMMLKCTKPLAITSLRKATETRHNLRLEATKFIDEKEIRDKLIKTNPLSPSLFASSSPSIINDAVKVQRNCSILTRKANKKPLFKKPLKPTTKGTGKKGFNPYHLNLSRGTTNVINHGHPISRPHVQHHFTNNPSQYAIQSVVDDTSTYVEHYQQNPTIYNNVQTSDTSFRGRPKGRGTSHTIRTSRGGGRGQRAPRGTSHYIPPGRNQGGASATHYPAQGRGQQEAQY